MKHNNGWFASHSSLGTLALTLALWASGCGDTSEGPLFAPSAGSGLGGASQSSGSGGTELGGAASVRGGSGGSPAGGEQASEGGRNSGGVSGAASVGGSAAGGSAAGRSAAGGGAAGGGSSDAGGASGRGGAGGEAGAQAGAGAGGESSGPDPFTCGSYNGVEVAGVRCFDFADPSSSASWQGEGGQWSVIEGGYVGRGPESPLVCVKGGSLMTASLIRGLVTRDLRLHAELTSLERVDKVLVLRSRDSGNRIELNFRARYQDGGAMSGGDLVLQELRDCVQTLHVGPGELPLPHELGQTIVVDLELRGSWLSVWVDGRRMFDASVSVSTEVGGVGVGVINGGSARFDDIFVEVLDG